MSNINNVTILKGVKKIDLVERVGGGLVQSESKKIHIRMWKM
jgi:hypothetical protein